MENLKDQRSNIILNTCLTHSSFIPHLKTTYYSTRLDQQTCYLSQGNIHLRFIFYLQWKLSCYLWQTLFSQFPLIVWTGPKTKVDYTWSILQKLLTKSFIIVKLAMQKGDHGIVIVQMDKESCKCQSKQAPVLIKT